MVIKINIHFLGFSIPYIDTPQPYFFKAASVSKTVGICKKAENKGQKIAHF